MATAAPKKKAQVIEKTQNIKVMVRIRPLNKVEQDMNVKSVVKCVSQREIMTKEKKFYFDRVFKPETEQIDIYKALVGPMIPDILNGYNCTIFAYGPTGSGKTYTMTGNTCQPVEHWDTDVDGGCIPRAAAHIFEELSAFGKCEINVKVSYLELYNEEIRDLLNDDDSVLPIYNDMKGSVFIQGLMEVSVYDGVGLCKQLLKGAIKRQTAPTLMNHQSSRSHTVFTITINSRETSATGEDILKSGKINLVDLAGSENIARSGCKDKRAVELANINKSLLTLGRVIHALADKSPKHVPYRDSKLTRILQDSLGGHTKTAIIATISPAATSYDVTVNTLDYASRARDIKNSPIVNEKLTRGQILQGLLQEIDRLQRDLDAARDKSGFYVNKENYDKLIDTVQFVTGEKLTVEELARKQTQRIKELEEIVATKMKEFDDNISECKKNKQMLRLAKTVIIEKKQSLEQERYVSQVYEEKVGQYHQDVKQLITTTETLSEEKGILQDKLEKQYHINVANESAGRMAVNQVLEMIKKISKEEENLKISDQHMNTVCREDLEDLKDSIRVTLNNLHEILEEMGKDNHKYYNVKQSLVTSLGIYINTIDKKSKDLRRKLEDHAAHLHDFEDIEIPVFLSHFKDVTKTFIMGINHVITEMQKDLNNQDKDLLDAVKKLRMEVELGKKEDELLYQKKMERSDQLLIQVDQFEKLITQKKDTRCQKVFSEMERREKEVWSLVTKMINSLNKSVPERKSSAPSPSDTNDFIEITASIRKEIVDNLYDTDRAEQSQKAADQVFENIESLSTVIESKVNVFNNRLDFMLDDRDVFVTSVEQFTKTANQILTDGFLEKVVPVTHEGDTPLRKAVVIPSPMDPPPREALIEKFKQEKPEGPEKISTSELDIGDTSEDSR